ncbi:anaphase-promoting complex subunit Hcn1 [Physocladia obscura]|uniref:Anaphase-promoting complex subunit Hcn1 n=1 Tax=Physocladia obscura TaxID=109957 RepID=A0AAD5T7I5_9FUNG|nr:anaphase-promoting complex subunit Hcn1 [Physocladia obscura]
MQKIFKIGHAVALSVANTFPVGYEATNPREQCVVIVFVMLGATLYACVVGAISSIAMGYDASGRMFKQKIDELKEYMNWKHINGTTQKKILNIMESGLFALLEEMNESLRNEISAHNCRELISKVPFLRREQNDGRDDLFIGRISSALKPCYFVAGDVLFVQGEVKIALIANIPRTATVQAASPCMLYRLTRAAFDTIANTFDDVKKKVDDIYTDRMNKIRLDEETRKIVVAKEMVSKVSFLRRSELDGRDDEWFGKLLDLMVPVFFATGETIFNQGDPGHEMYIIKTGRADILVGGYKVTELEDNACFGGIIHFLYLLHCFVQHIIGQK